MKFSCSSSDLLNALQTAVHALPVHSTMPILEGLMLETVPDGLIITASNGTLTIVTKLAAEVEVEGCAVLPGRLLVDVIRKLPEGEVSAQMSMAYVLTLKCMGSRTNIAGQNADAYPKIDTASATTDVTLPQSLIKDMIQRVSFAIPAEDNRAILTGGYFEMMNGRINLVGLDGFRIAIRTALSSDTESVVKAIIPEKSLDELGRLMQDDPEQMITLRFGENTLTAEIGSTLLYTSLIDGEYIDYRRVIPKSFTTEVLLSRDEFARCVESASLMAREGKNNRVTFKVWGDKLFISSNSDVGDVLEEMDIQNSGDDLEIAFNVKYMLELIRVINGSDMYLKFNNPVSPVMVSPASGDEYTYLVLPVRVSA